MKGLLRDIDTLKNQGWDINESDEKEMREVLEIMDKEFIEAEKKLARATVGPANQVLGEFDQNSDTIMVTWENISNESDKARKRRQVLLRRYTNKLDSGSPPGSDFKGEEFAVVDPEGFKAPTPRDYLDEAYPDGNYNDPPTEEQIMKAFVASQADDRELTLANGQRVGVTEYYNTNDAGKIMGRIAVGVAKDKNYKTDEEGKKKLTEFYGIVEDARKEGLAALRSANEKLQNYIITDDEGDEMTMGDAVQGLDMIQKLHLGMIDGDNAPGLYGSGSIALVAGEDTVTEENMKKCLGVDSTKELLKQIKVRPPKKEGPTFKIGGVDTYESEVSRARVTKDDQSKAAKKDGKFIYITPEGTYAYLEPGEEAPKGYKQLGIITGAKALIAIQDSEGREMEIGCPNFKD